MKAREEGIEEGLLKEKWTIAQKFLVMDLSLEQISNVTGLSLDEIKNLQDKHN